MVQKAPTTIMLGEVAPTTRKAARNGCRDCAVWGTSLCSAVPRAASDEMRNISVRRRFAAGQVLRREQEGGRSFAIIVSGVVKLVKAQPDGRHQIVGLQFSSDFLGQVHSDGPALLAEAASDLQLCCFSGPAFAALMQDHPEIERAILKQTTADLDAAREWMFVLGRKTAQERVASLLLMIAQRGGALAKKGGGLEIDLPLSRTEIADFLCLRLETVCRLISKLRRRGVIRTTRRRIVEVPDPAELIRYAETIVA